MIKDTLKSFKTSSNCVLLTGNACELTVSFEYFAEMVKELSKDLPASMRQDIAVAGWSSGGQRDLLSLLMHAQPYTDDPGQGRHS
jgi:hypothetical protein